jgi:serine/threonine protein kinase
MSQPDQLQAGHLGKYQILTRLSVGGMAEIFLAVAPGPHGDQRLVTLKRILPELREREEFVHMFLDEARISASLAHPHIAQVYELGHEGEEIFIAMEFIAGQSLASILRRCQRQKRPVPVGFIAMVGRDLCKALDCAHNFTQRSGEHAPIIHRDVSPANVMVTYEGEVKVIDFGVAKAAGSLSRTATGTIKGSRGYMSPEQARGAPLDARSDIFSAGIVLHELLTGQPLFLRDSELATFRGVLRDEIPTAISINPGVPRPLSDVVATALSRAVDSRFPNAKEMSRAISNAIPSLISSTADASVLMKQLFSEELRQTEALLKAQTKSTRSLEDAAQRLRELGVPKSGGTQVYGPLPTGVMRLGEEPEEKELPAAPAAPAVDAEPAVEGATVLSVDDSEISRDFIEAHLESSGFPVLHCASAPEALRLIQERLPDLILLDVMMPGVNGFELCRLLRERCTARPFLPIIFLTSASTFEQRLEGLAAGGDDFIIKPYHPPELIGLIRAHLRRAAFLEQQRIKARAAR